MPIYGQNLRIYVDGKCVALATDCTAHAGVSFDDTTTKDSTGSWEEKIPVGKTWDVSVSALVAYKDTSDTTGVYVEDLFDSLSGDTLVTIKFTTTTGDKNRTAKTSVNEYTGNAYISDISVKATNKQKGTCDVKIDGTGALTKTAVPSNGVGD